MAYLPICDIIPLLGEDLCSKARGAKRVQPGTGDNLTRDDIANGYTDYVIWNRFKPERLDIDGELDMECVDSGMAAERFAAFEKT